MKKLLFITLLFSVFANSQIVNIPDANFKAKLINLGIDTNSDGNIQQSEALVPTGLFLENSNISDLTGLQSFINLTSLHCENNEILSLNIYLNSLPNLTILRCKNNPIDTLNVALLTNIVDLRFSANQMTTFDVSSLTNLIFLDIVSSSLISFTANNLNSLFDVSLQCNNITSIYISNCPQLGTLTNFASSIQNMNLTLINCNSLIGVGTLSVASFNNLQITNNSTITSLGFIVNNNLILSGLPNLTFLNVSCQFNTLNISNLPNLSNLYITGILLNSLSLNNLPQVLRLEIFNTNLQTLDISNFPNLGTLLLNQNPLSSLSLNNISQLSSLQLDNTNLQDLDLSNIMLLQSLQCVQNPNLTSINLKNGAIETNISISSNPNLQFICADQEQILNIQSLVSQNIVVNSYCTFTPSGNYNTITGITKFDANNNGCDTNDLPQKNIRVNINDGTTTGASFTNSTGNYKFYTQAGNFNVTPSIENTSWFYFSPITATIPFANNNNNVATQDFCIAANGIHNDLEIVIAPTTTARPGFNAEYLVTYKNKGNQTVSGNLNFNYDDSILDFVSSTFATTTQSAGILNYDFINLQPFESRSFYVTLNVNSPTETPAVNIGDILNFSAAINTTLSDEIPSDNLFTYNQTVVGSFDPNDITCMEGESVSTSEIGNYLHYVINFENTGTFQAENIVVKTTIDPNQFDINSLQLLSASNQVDARITGNVVEFIF
ncbi:hypothetical protein, partial [Flavobacterium sp.]|uniref:DUF7619 domain-containing protein n=1 Tax=Flavobacterium sp. TaxID=239 RepID=UPI0037534289